MIGVVFVQAALAAQVALRLETDEVREGQTVQLDLVVIDTTARDVPRIAAPDGMQVAYKGQSVERQIVNFQSTSTTTFSYALTALAAGDYVVGPVTVATAAGPLTTAALPVKVGARAAGGLDSLTATLGTDVAWVGQVLVYELEFRTDKNIVNGRWTPPDAPGFTTEPSVEPITSEYRLEQDGKPLAVQELSYPLRASSPGKWTVPGGVLQAQYAVTDPRRRRQGILDGIGAFGNVRTEVYSASPLQVEVRALPTEGRPADASGLVGAFTVEAKASQPTTRVGETVTLEVTVEGTGALAGFALPVLDAPNLKVYDDQPVVEARIEDGAYRSRATFKRALVPQVPGTVEVPPVELAYFDPGKGAWERASSAPVRLTVEGEAKSAAIETFTEGGPKQVDSLGEDILPVRTDVRLSRPWPRGLALALLAPGGLLLAAQGVGALRRRPTVAAADRPLGFDDLPAEPEARLAALERIFRERVGAKLGVPADALRREDLAGLAGKAPEAEAIYRELERCRYGGAAQGVPVDRVRAFVEGL